MLCEQCGRSEEVQLEDSRTCYVKPAPTWYERILSKDEGLTPTSEVGEDPNQPIWLCRDCAAEHHRFYDDQWKEFYSGLL